jgi:hypothetical protein
MHQTFIDVLAATGVLFRPVKHVLGVLLCTFEESIFWLSEHGLLISSGGVHFLALLSASQACQARRERGLRVAPSKL